MATPPTTARDVRETAGYSFELHCDADVAPPILDAGNEAFGLFIACALLSRLTDAPGYVTRTDAETCATAKRLDTLVARLVDADLWQREGGGWRMVPRPRDFHCAPTLWRMRPADRRDSIPTGLRAAVYERDGHACLECGATKDLTLDHIHPWSKGGPDTYENLRVLCRPCNSSKGARV